MPQLGLALAGVELGSGYSADQAAVAGWQISRQSVLSTKETQMRTPQSMEQTVRHARPQGRVTDDMLPGRMLGPTTQDSTMPTRIL